MTDFASKILGSSQSAPAGKDFAGAILGTRTPSSDELVNDPSRQTGPLEQFKAGFASDAEEELRVFAQSMFPNEPIDEAVNRFAVTEQGDLFARTDEGEFLRVTPPDKVNQALGAVLRGVGKSIPVATGTATGIATAPLAMTGAGLPVSMALTGGAFALGEIIRQKGGDLILGKASTGDIAVAPVVTEGGLGMLGQGIGTGIGQFAQRAQVRDIARIDPAATRRTFQESGRQGVRVTPGQATGSRALLADEKRLATRIPETVDQMDDFLRQQGDDTVAAFNRFLGRIAPEADAEQVARQVRGAAQGVLDDAIAERAKVARPLYQRAFSESGPVDINPVMDEISGQLKTVPKNGTMASALNAVRRLLTESGGGKVAGPGSGLKSVRSPALLSDAATPARPLTDLQRLHGARVEIRNMIDTRTVPGPTGTGTSINNTIAGKLRRILGDLTRAMDAGSATDDAGAPLYRTARTTFSEVSGDVDDVFQSSLARIANLKDAGVLSVVREAFNPKTRSPQMILKLRAAIAKKDPAAWQGMKRLWLGDTIGEKLRTTEQGQVLNPAGKIVKALDDFGLKRSINAALSGPEKKRLGDLKFLLRRLAKLQIGGSDTAANTAADKDALRRATPIWARAQRGVLNFWKLPDAIADAASERNMRNQAQQMVDLITSGDQNAIEGLKELRKLTPRQWRLLAGSGQLAVRAPGAVSAGLDALDNESDQPPNNSRDDN